MARLRLARARRRESFSSRKTPPKLTKIGAKITRDPSSSTYRISLNATVPGLYLCGFLTPPVVGADLRAALVASCFLGALPPVDLRAVCFVRAMVKRVCSFPSFFMTRSFLFWCYKQRKRSLSRKRFLRKKRSGLILFTLCRPIRHSKLFQSLFQSR